MNRTIGMKATDRKRGIPCRDLARIFAEAAEIDPFAKVSVRVGWKGQVQSVAIEFPYGGGIAPEGESDA
jgi:hypothetical protein